MRGTARFVLLAPLLCIAASCGGYEDRYAFRTVDEQTEAPGGQASGLRWASYLEGVVEVPAEGPPARRYELVIELEQPRSGGPAWEPALAGARLRDDEGLEIPLSAVFRDAAARRPGLDRYRAVFELSRPYRFRSIGDVRLRWTLRAAGQRPLQIASRYRH